MSGGGGSTPTSPPRLAGWLIGRVLPARSQEVVLGDLEERWRARAARDGRARAWRWYWRQSIGFAVRVPFERAAALSGGGEATGRNGRAGGAVRAFAGLGGDVRLALRSIRRRPALALTATAVLAVAVGANTTVFTVVDAILLKRLPYPEADRLMMLWDTYPTSAGRSEPLPISLDHYRAWSERPELFDAVGAWETTTPSLAQGEWPERVDGALVTSSLLPMLGARPRLGRLFAPADEAAGAAPVVILSHDLWAGRYGADPAIVGRSIELNGVATQVVGVLTEDFWFYDPYAATRSLTGSNAESARLWQPLPANVFGGETDYPRYRVIARVRDGLSGEAAAAAATSVRRRLPPTSSGPDGELSVVSLTEQIVAEARPRLLGLFGAVSLVLLIACVNLVSLLLVHLEARRPELAVRAALGASRARLTRQLVAETTLLALIGGVAGVVVSAGATSLLLDLVPRGLPLAHRARLDATVAAFGLGLAALSGMAIGLVTALRIDPRRLAGTIASSTRTMAGSRTGRRLHGALVASEVALSVVLLIGATLLLRSLIGLRATETGFDARGVLTFESLLATAPGADPNYAFYADLESRIAALPGVAAVGATSALPFSRWGQSAAVETSPVPAGGETPRVDYRLVSPGYFDAVGLPRHRGRGFADADRSGAPDVVVVNEAFVARWLDGDPNPVGRTIAVTWWRERTQRTIVGVVANVKHAGLVEEPRPIVYAPVRQSPIAFQRFAVRVTDGDPLRLVEQIRRAAAVVDPAQPLQGFITFDALIGQSIEQETFYTRIVTAFALTAVLLTLMGIYGVVAFVTRQRDREVAIRVALGAGAGSVRRLVVAQGLAPVGIGLVVGCAGALAASRLLRGLLHGVPPHDVASYATALAAFAVVAAAACAIPARRAARLDPMRIMRGD